MPAFEEFLYGFVFVALLAAIIVVNLFLHRHPRKEIARDSEVVLGELRLALENATQPCRLMDMRQDPGAFSGRAHGFGLYPSPPHYRIVRMEFFNHHAPASAAPGKPRGLDAEWRCGRDALAAGIAHVDLEYEQQLERMLLVIQAGEGVYEAVYCKAGDFMSTGGGILKLSFNGRHLGIVNFGADGTITDAKNRRVGKAGWDGASMSATLYGKKYMIAGPKHMGSAFSILEGDPDVSGAVEDGRMLLLCLSVFNQAYRRSRRVARNA